MLKETETEEARVIFVIFIIGNISIGGVGPWPPSEYVFALLFSIKLVLLRNKCYQYKLVCTRMMNEWGKILPLKTLTKVNRT